MPGPNPRRVRHAVQPAQRPRLLRHVLRGLPARVLHLSAGRPVDVRPHTSRSVQTVRRVNVRFVTVVGHHCRPRAVRADCTRGEQRVVAQSLPHSSHNRRATKCDFLEFLRKKSRTEMLTQSGCKMPLMISSSNLDFRLFPAKKNLC